MTPSEGYDLATFQLPGYKIVMGPTEARLAPISPAPRSMKQYPRWHLSWERVNLFRNHGIDPSALAKAAADAAQMLGYTATTEEWRWLEQKSTSLADTQAWLASKARAPQ